MGQTSAAATGIPVQLKDSGIDFEAFGKTRAGLIVCIVEKSVPGVRSTVLDIGSDSIRLIRHSLSGGIQSTEAASSGWSALRE
jgi:hypothetical protein